MAAGFDCCGISRGELRRAVLVDRRVFLMLDKFGPP